MSELETVQGGNKWADEDDDCPLCLEPLPPFWDAVRRSRFVCCGKTTCSDCRGKRAAYLDKALAEGSFGREERQLASCCPLCRSQIPTGDDVRRLMLDRYEKGQLPLDMYFNLGWNLIEGDGGGVEKNVERGIEILMLGAKKGDPSCQYCLGDRYRVGTDGLPKSASEAKRWYLAATEQGHAIAESQLALMLTEEGNDAEYLRHLRGSASKGYDDACFNLGRACYYGDYGLQKSSEEAIRVLTPAAERGHADSMCLLGGAMCMPHSLLTPRENPSFVKGMQWARRGAEKGDQRSIAQLKWLEEKLSNNCFRCNKEAPPEKAFLRCSRCRAAWYCSKDCQVQHWRAAEAGHKQFCIKWESE